MTAPPSASARPLLLSFARPMAREGERGACWKQKRSIPMMNVSTLGFLVLMATQSSAAPQKPVEPPAATTTTKVQQEVISLSLKRNGGGCQSVTSTL
jgi:biopolymer transport protein ExbD